MIFQSFNLLMQRTCPGQRLLPHGAHAASPRAQARKRAQELLDLVGLEDKAGAYPAQLSGGQKQRVAIARALATDPKVLLCDEATSALDPTTTASILALLKELNQKLGVTVVVITHQMSVIEEICSRVAILDGGVVAEQGAVEDIFSHPHTDAARRLVYPGGVQHRAVPAQGPGPIRVAFNGGTAYQPLIASLAIDCGVKVNILGADTRNIEGKAFGTMLLGLPDDPNEAAKALQLYPVPAQYHRRGGGIPCLRSISAFWAEYGNLLLRGHLGYPDYGGDLHRLRLSHRPAPGGGR